MLPLAFKPGSGYELIRLGKKNDGGYLVDSTSLENVHALFAFGISNDWSFESDFARHRPTRIEAYDHTISDKVFLRRFIWALPRVNRPWLAWNSLKALFGYKRFFSTLARHHAYRIGYSGPQSKCLDEVIGTENNLFLKIDIEGAEYQILDELVKASPRIEGLVIEFHEIDLHIDRILKFLRDTSLYLCHIHGNNFGGTDANGDPLVVEMSFSRFAPPHSSSTESGLPHVLDMPNDPRLPEIDLKFES